MQYFTAAVVAFSTFAVFTSATPIHTKFDATKPDAITIQARDNKPGIYMCDQSNWKGDCRWDEVKPGQCVSLPYRGAISFGPDPGIRCKIFQDANCNGSAGFIAFPGTANTKDFTEQYGRKVFQYNAYQCVRSAN